MEHLKLVNIKRVCEFKIILTSTSIFLLNLAIILVLGLFDSSIDDGQFFVLNIVFLFKICFETMTNFFIVTIQIQLVRPKIRNRENHQGYRGRLLKKLGKNQVKNEERLIPVLFTMAFFLEMVCFTKTFISITHGRKWASVFFA